VTKPRVTKPRATKPPAKAQPKAKANLAKSPSFVGQIFRAYAGLRQSFAGQLGAGFGEERLLAYAALFCFLAFVASIPAALRTDAFFDDGMLLPGIVIGRFVGLMFFGPLFLYGVAAVSRLVAGYTFGGTGTHFGARVSLFWSLLLLLPLMLVQALILQALSLTALSHLSNLVSVPVFLIWLWIWATGIAQSEGFSQIGVFLFLITVVLVLYGFTLVSA